MILGLRRHTALAAVIALCFGLTTKAIEKHFVIPETVPAIDLNTGGPYYAPPVPGGHYTKDPLGKVAGKVHGTMAHLKGVVGSLCATCGGTGQCAGCGEGAATGAMGACGTCGGHGILSGGNGGSHVGHNHGASVANTTYAGGGGGAGHGLFSGHGGQNTVVAQAPAVAYNEGATHAKSSPQAMPAAQSPTGQSPCANGGCGGSKCGDPACHGILGGKKLFGGNKGSNGCGTPGCTSPGCGNGGLFAGHGNGMGGGCGTPGCTSCGDGAGMGHPSMGHPGMGHPGLGSKLAGLLGLGQPKVKYFVGPGGPVPITPGYVQWVNPVRSPRDFFAFPPYLDQAMQPGFGSMPQSSAGFATDRATTPTDFMAPAPVPPPAPRQ